MNELIDPVSTIISTKYYMDIADQMIDKEYSV